MLKIKLPFLKNTEVNAQEMQLKEYSTSLTQEIYRPSQIYGQRRKNKYINERQLNHIKAKSAVASIIQSLHSLILMIFCLIIIPIPGKINSLLSTDKTKLTRKCNYNETSQWINFYWGTIHERSFHSAIDKVFQNF